MTRLKLRGTILLALVTLSACAGLAKRLEPPRVSIADFRVQEIQMMETVFLIQLRVFNTNDVALQVKGLQCDLELNDQAFATGVSNTPVEIPSYGTQTVPVTVYSSIVSMFKGAWGMQNREELRYRLKGKLRLGAETTMPAVIPFTAEGRVTLKGPPPQSR